MNILIALSNKDFDVTEVAIPWKAFKEKGYNVGFATQDGEQGQPDPLLLTGVIFGQLKAKPNAIRAFRELEKDPAYQNPSSYANIEVSHFDLIHLPGGHAKGMIPYLEDKILQQKVLAFYQQKKVIGAICHGSLILTRTKDPKTGKSIVYNRKITGLIKRLEKIAYYITAWKLGDYYRTYPQYTEDEIRSGLKNPDQFETGYLNFFKPFVCEDDNLITARWPEDAQLLAERLIEKLEEKG